MIEGFSVFSTELILCFLLALFLRRTYLENLTWAFFAGLLVDYFSDSVLGFNVLVFAVIVFVIDFLKRKLALKEMHFSIVAIIVFFGTILSDFLILFFSNLLLLVKILDNPISIDFSWNYFLVKILLAVIGFFFYRTILFIEKVFGIGLREIRIDKI